MRLPSYPQRAASPLPANYVVASCGQHPLSNHADCSSESEYDESIASNDEADEVFTASGSEAEDCARGPRRRQRIHFDVEKLQTVYHLPLKTAAERLGICEAALKRICRRNYIQKWPYRQLSSVRRRITELKDRRVGRPENETYQECQELFPYVTPEQFDMKLHQLEEEQNQIIQLAHQPRRVRKPIQSASTMSSYQHELNEEQNDKWLIVDEEELEAHCSTGIQSTIAELPPLDLNRVDRDFPLLFLANVCESIRAYL